MTTNSTPKPATSSGSRMPSPRRDLFGFSDLRDEMDRIWETMFTRGRPGSSSFVFNQTLPVDVFEKDGQLHVRAELPGIDEKDIDIEVTQEGLTINGEKKEEHEVKEDSYYRSERSYGRFTRHISLPEGADTDKAEAHFNKGVLEIDMPVRAEEGRKKIEVKTQSQ